MIERIHTILRNNSTLLLHIAYHGEYRELYNMINRPKNMRKALRMRMKRRRALMMIMTVMMMLMMMMMARMRRVINNDDGDDDDDDGWMKRASKSHRYRSFLTNLH